MFTPINTNIVKNITIHPSIIWKINFVSIVCPFLKINPAKNEMGIIIVYLAVILIALTISFYFFFLNHSFY